jgi:hypothetical protein
VKKHLRRQEIALQNRLPCVYLVDSGGANLPHQAEVFPDREHFGRIFYNQARMSAEGIAQIACVMGSCTAGGAYVPGHERRDDHRARPGTIFLGRSAAGEGRHRRGDHRRGTGRRRHPRPPLGVVDHVAEDDEHALTIVRRIVANLNTTKTHELTMAEPEPPAYDPEELYGVVPTDVRAPYDVREVIARSSTAPLRRVQGALRHDPGLRLRAHLGLSGRDPGQQRGAVLRERAEGRPLHRAGLQAEDPAGVPAEHLRLHGRRPLRGRRHRQGRGQAGHRRRLAEVPSSPS